MVYNKSRDCIDQWSFEPILGWSPRDRARPRHVDRVLGQGTFDILHAPFMIHYLESAPKSLSQPVQGIGCEPGHQRLPPTGTNVLSRTEFVDASGDQMFEPKRDPLPIP